MDRINPPQILMDIRQNLRNVILQSTKKNLYRPAQDI